MSPGDCHMSEWDSKKQSEHWRELAAQLGLPPDQGSHEASPKLKTSQSKRSGTGEETNPHLLRQDRAQKAAEHELKSHSDKTSTPPSSGDDILRAADNESDFDDVAPPTEKGAESILPNRGSRRRPAKRPRDPAESGRRGRRRVSHKRESRDELTAESSQDASGVSGDPRADDPDFSEPEPAIDKSQDNEELDTLSDWNVPTWAELIASLYRPER